MFCWAKISLNVLYFNLSPFNSLSYSLVFYLCNKLKSHFSSSKTSCASYDKFKSPCTFCTFICRMEYPTHFSSEFGSPYIAKFMFSISITIVCCPRPFLIYFWLVLKFIIIIPEPQLIFDLITAELISSNLLYSFEGQKYGILYHYQLRLPLVYPSSKESFLISSVSCMKRPTSLTSF